MKSNMKFDNTQLAKELSFASLLVNDWDEFVEHLDSPEERALKLKLFNSVGTIPTMIDGAMLFDEDTGVNLEHYRYQMQVQYMDALKVKYGSRVVHIDYRTHNVIYVGRGRGGRLGNPFSHITSIKGLEYVDSRVEACMAYKLYIQNVMKTNSNMVLLQTIKAIPADGVVACWCNLSGDIPSTSDAIALDHFCHGMVILSVRDLLNKETV